MKSQQSDTKTTKQVRIDAEMHRLLKIEAAKRQTSIKSLIQEGLEGVLEVKGKYL